VGGAMAISRFAEWDTAISPQSIFLALAFSAGIGLFFGLWPAQRAAKLNPIDALRYE
jgi:putative ABC transport system permease protein